MTTGGSCAIVTRLFRNYLWSRHLQLHDNRHAIPVSSLQKVAQRAGAIGRLEESLTCDGQLTAKSTGLHGHGSARHVFAVLRT
jgi:hypothetical protein